MLIFILLTKSVIVPTFRSKKDDKALDIIAECFPGRKNGWY
ncbi:MAG: agmatine deiminase family protein [Chitinophagaceae bacterium]